MHFQEHAMWEKLPVVTVVMCVGARSDHPGKDSHAS